MTRSEPLSETFCDSTLPPDPKKTHFAQGRATPSHRSAHKHTHARARARCPAAEKESPLLPAAAPEENQKNQDCRDSKKPNVFFRRGRARAMLMYLSVRVCVASA